MKRKIVSLAFLILLSSIVLSACIGLIPLEEEPVTGDFGPQVTPREHQTRTFEALWTLLQDNYIHYETSDVEWDGLRSAYQKRIDAGLTAGEFAALMRELEADLPEGSMLYQSRAERVEGDIVDDSTYQGIGAFVGFNPEPQPHIILLSIIKGSPAEQAGLKAHDSIFAIDGSPVLLEEGITAVNRIRGPSGTTVKLNVRTPGRMERIVEVKRGKLTSIGQLEVSRIAGTNHGYLLFPPVAYDGLIQDVLGAMQAFTTNQKLEGLILDLRIAGSSRGWPLEAMFTIFNDGVLGEFFNRKDKELIRLAGQDYFGSQSVPLVILVGKNTQGFPEIFAGSLQLQKRAVIIGETTPGGIETTTSYLLPDGSRIFLETTSFRLPNGGDIGDNGVRPDVRIEAGWDEILPNRDPVLNAAVEVFRSQP
jgi:carboxyl-terminal processing protease